MPDVFDEYRKQGNEDDAKDDSFEIILYDIRGAEPKAQQGEAHHPYESTDHVEGNELPVIHLAYTGHERREGPHYRYEAGDNDGLGAVLFKKGMCFIDVLLF